MRHIFFILSLVIGFAAKAGTATSSKTIDMNKQGTELLKKQNFTAAQDKFAAGLAQSPFSPELQYNLGLAFDGAGNAEKAKQAYELAAKNAKDPETQFAANFNLGELAGRAKKVDDALAYYQQALLANPESVETKTNIELLVQSQKNKDGKDGDKNDKDNKDNKDKDKKDKQNKEKKDDSKDNKDKKDDSGEKEKEKEKEKNGYDQSKPQPKPFKSDQLSQGDVKKILEELDRQEQRVRAEYNKKQAKEKPHDKDW